MERIVRSPLKVDFHIHSHASHHKDHSLVSSGTAENIPTLLAKLKSYEVDAFAITDHDCFDADLYRDLKKHEGTDFKKVFPGVEFSVWYAKERKQIHVIAVFDDTAADCVEKIKNVVGYDPNVAPAYDEQDHSCFTEGKFRDLLFKIDVNAILIVHQKGSALPEASPSNQDLKSLGKEKMNELINVEYFDALEFKKPGRHIFQTLFAKSMNTQTYDKVKYLTGSDCHQWEHYPMHDLLTNDPDIQYSYLKCLPSFRGLVMAVTDYSRIGRSDQLFQGVSPCLEAIEITSKGEQVTIPLSKGINVIIGDNSTGKSALLHKLTGYSQLNGSTGLPQDLKTKYEAFFQKNELTIQTKSLDNKNYDFLVQGGVRYKFEGGNFFEAFSKDKYPEETCAQPYKDYIQSQLSPAYESIHAKHEFDNALKDLPDITISEAPDNAGICTVITCPTNVFPRTKGLSNIISSIEKVLSAYKSLLDKITDEEEKNQLISQRNYIVQLRDKYAGIRSREAFLENTVNALRIGIENYTTDKNQLFTDAETRHSEYQNATLSIASSLPKIIELKQGIKAIDFAKVIPMEVVYSEKPYGDVKFCSRFKKSLTEINKEYVSSLFKSVFKEDKKDSDILDLSEDELTSIIKNANDEKGKSGLDLLKAKIEAQIDDDFESKKMLTKNGEDCTSEYSAGFNSSMFFSFVGNDFDKKTIFIVDQPEDDISQNGISSETIPDFKKLSGRRQVIIITHNPQFVVNLDADNVIHISKDKDGIHFQNGALEYKDEAFDVLSTIENNLDGGEDSIKKRWRRYEKTDNKNNENPE